MEATMVYWGYIGMMENRLETTIVYDVKIRIGTVYRRDWAYMAKAECGNLKATAAFGKRYK